MTAGREPGRHAAGDEGGRAPITRLTRAPRRAAGTPPSSTRRGVRLAAQIVAAVLSVSIVVGTGWAWQQLRTFNRDVSVGAAVASPDSTGTGTDGPTYPKRDLNILLLGNDSRAGATPDELRALGTQDDGGSANTDTMLVLHVPADGSRATAISFPRDSYVDIPGYGKSKLNSAYPDGYQTAADQGANEVARQSAGIQVLISTLNKLTGLTIDHYVQVNLLGFYRISIALKGVQVCLREDVKEANSGIDLKAGTQTIEGTQALAFVRQRYGFPDGRGDLDRIQRQQYFLSAVFRKVLSAGTLLNPGKINSLLHAVSSSLLIDPNLKPLALASQLSGLSAGNLNFYTIPLAGEDNNSPAGDVILVDPAAVQSFVQKTFYPPATPTAPPTSATTTSPGAPTSTSPAAPTTSASTVNSAQPTPVNGADANCVY
ncbi:LCP family protein [Jatrophihabitans sp. YIM 134969]